MSKQGKLLLLTVTMFVVNVCTINAQLNTVRLSPGGKYGDENLIGEVNRQGFLAEPYSEWFENNYNDYKPNGDILKKIKPFLKDIEITVFLGTWCKDSKREIPRLYKILDELKYKEKNLTIFALGIAPNEFKKSPNGDEKGKNIIRVPSIIIKQKGSEIGRIIEHSVKLLEEDIYSILNNNNYKPNYAIESEVNNYFVTYGLNTFIENIDTLAIYYKLKNISKNNLAHYVAWNLVFTEKFHEAVAVLNMMLKIYPEYASYYLTLAQIYEYQGKNKLALQNYSKAVKNIKDNKFVNWTGKAINELTKSYSGY